MKAAHAYLGLQQRFNLYWNTRETPPLLKDALRLEKSFNLARMATIAGALVAADGRSPATTLFMVMDAQLQLAPTNETISVRRVAFTTSRYLRGKLITEVILPLQVRLAFHSAGGHPLIYPWFALLLPNGLQAGVRVVSGGYGETPMMVMDWMGASRRQGGCGKRLRPKQAMTAQALPIAGGCWRSGRALC